MFGVSATDDLSNVSRQAAHPFDVGHVLHRPHDDSQVRCHWSLQGQQHKSSLLGSGLHLRQAFVVGDHRLGKIQVGLQQRVRGPFHRQPGQSAHLA